MKILNLVLAFTFAASLALACKGGGEMAIEDSSGKQIGVVIKGQVIQIVPNQGEYFISEGAITASGKAVHRMVYIPGALSKGTVLNAATFDRNAVVTFTLVNKSRQFVGKYSSSINEMTRVARSGGCGGTLKAAK